MALYFFLFFFKVKGVCGVVFFFQAEDGIRDADVTGVQTCALPIYGPPGAFPRDRPSDDLEGVLARPRRGPERTHPSRRLCLRRLVATATLRSRRGTGAPETGRLSRRADSLRDDGGHDRQRPRDGWGHH